MTLGVLLNRRSHLKVLSPVISASMARGHTTVLVAIPTAAKKGDALDTRELDTLYPGLPIKDSLIGLDALVGIESVLPPSAPCRLVGVDHFQDSWIRPPRTDPDFVMCYTSRYHATTHHGLYGTGEGGYVVGWLPADQAARITPCKRDAAVFFALKLDVPEPWRHSAEGKEFYKRIARAAKRTAEAAGLRFIVKSRAKNHDPLWLRWLADDYVLDECMVPYTSLSLLARAKWAVQFESGAVFECAVMGAYSLAVQVPQTHVSGLRGGAEQYGGISKMHHWPGVSQYGLPWGAVPTQDGDAQAAYLEHFLGPCDGNAGDRVVTVAEG